MVLNMKSNNMQVYTHSYIWCFLLPNLVCHYLIFFSFLTVLAGMNNYKAFAGQLMDLIITVRNEVTQTPRDR